MKRVLFSIFFILCFAVWLKANAPLSDNDDRPQFAADRFLVKLSREAYDQTNLPAEYNARTNSFGITELDAILKKLKATAVIRAHIRPKDTNWEQKTGFNRWFVVEVPIGTDIIQAVDQFSGLRLIDQALPEYYHYPMLYPNDTYFANNWGHNNTIQFPSFNTATMQHDGPAVGLNSFDSNATSAWDYPQGCGSNTVIIAIIDTGFDRSHPDLHYVTGYDFGCGDSNPDFAYNESHGTCCAGIAAGIANNSFGVTGIAGGCYIMPLKIMDRWGYLGITATNNSLIYAADHGADVASMSFGSTDGGLQHTYHDSALEYAYTHGVTLFAATGNDDTSQICYPAYNTNVISVGAASPTGQRKSATSSDGEFWWGSNWGNDTQDNRYAVDIMGPTILPTTDIMGEGGHDPGNYFLWFNGTSCATPYVAGVAALLKARNPSLTPDQIRTALTTSAIDMYPSTAPGWDRWTGYGFVNAYYTLYNVSDGMPFCNIYAPESAKGYSIGSNLTVIAYAFDTNSGGSIDRVEFFRQNLTTPVSTDTSYPYSLSWNTAGYSPGMYIVMAKAYDNEGNYTTDYIIVYLVNPATDGFEATFLTTLPWMTSGDADWELQTDEYFCGSKAVRSGLLTDGGDSSTLSFTLNFISGGSYSFYRKLNSETDSDYYRFYIDNVLQVQWSGNQYWSSYTGTVSSGLHQFKWVYTHGGGGLHYGCAFLDHLILPAYSANINPDIQWWPNSFVQNLPTGAYTSQTLHISNWNSPTVNFLAYLPCTTESILYETFPETVLPTNWQSISETGSRPWVVNTGGYNSQPPAAYDGLYNARLTILAAAAITRLTVPYMDLSLATSATLTFWHTQAPVQTGGTGGLGVYYKTSAGGTWTLLTSYSTTYANWTREVIALPNLSPTYYISFLGAGNSYYCICLDQITVTKQNYAVSTTTWCRFETTPYITDSIGPMSFYSYMVQFSSIGLAPGTYTSQITITSNCTANPVIIIPLTLNVYDPAILIAPTITHINLSTSVTGEAIELLWNSPPGFPDSYNIYRAYQADFSDAVLIGNVPSGQTRFLDPVEFTDRKAFYRVTAVRN